MASLTVSTKNGICQIDMQTFSGTAPVHGFTDELAVAYNSGDLHITCTVAESAELLAVLREPSQTEGAKFDVAKLILGLRDLDPVEQDRILQSIVQQVTGDRPITPPERLRAPRQQETPKPVPAPVQKVAVAPEPEPEPEPTADQEAYEEHAAKLGNDMPRDKAEDTARDLHPQGAADAAAAVARVQPRATLTQPVQVETRPERPTAPSTPKAPTPPVEVAPSKPVPVVSAQAKAVQAAAQAARAEYGDGGGQQPMFVTETGQHTRDAPQTGEAPDTSAVTAEYVPRTQTFPPANTPGADLTEFGFGETETSIPIPASVPTPVAVQAPATPVPVQPAAPVNSSEAPPQVANAVKVSEVFAYYYAQGRQTAEALAEAAYLVKEHSPAVQRTPRLKDRAGRWLVMMGHPVDGPA